MSLYTHLVTTSSLTYVVIRLVTATEAGNLVDTIGPGIITFLGRIVTCEQCGPHHIVLSEGGGYRQLIIATL